MRERERDFLSTSWQVKVGARTTCCSSNYLLPSNCLTCCLWPSIRRSLCLFGWLVCLSDCLSAPIPSLLLLQNQLWRFGHTVEISSSLSVGKRPIDVELEVQILKIETWNYLLTSNLWASDNFSKINFSLSLSFYLIVGATRGSSQWAKCWCCQTSRWSPGISVT